MSTQEIRPGFDVVLGQTERDLGRSAGIALLIVGLNPSINGENKLDPLFWTIRELEDKPSTKKRAGEISIPAETRKVGESRASNVLGALAEFCDDSRLDYVKNHLFLIDGLFHEKGIWINGNGVDVSVLIYDGDMSLDFAPHNKTEVGPKGWLRRSQILKEDGVRSVLSQAVSIDINAGLSSRAIDSFYAGPHLAKRVFPEDFVSIDSFYIKREQLPDIILKSS